MPDLARPATFVHRADRLVDSASAGRRRLLLPGSRFLAVFAAIGLVLATAATSVLADTPPPPAGPTPISGSITFYGRGYGHGVGMSQYGARGRAIAGQDAATILAHYYPGTTIGAVDPQTQVRVLLRSGFHPTAEHPARVVGRLGPWTIDGLPNVFPADAALTVIPILSASPSPTPTPAPTPVATPSAPPSPPPPPAPPTTWQLTVTGSDGTVLYDAPLTGGIRARPAASETLFEVPFKSAVYGTYRGVIRLIAGTRAIAAINEVGLDDYLLGVVPLEMPQSWPTQALRAQAIAARTYALGRLHPSKGTWDVYDDTRSQLYRGVVAEKPTTAQAIRDTTGQILTIGGAIANTPFHSSDGGATENNENVYTSWRGAVVVKPVPELRGSSDRAPDGTSYDASAPSATWQTATYTVDELATMMGADARTNVGTITALDLSARGVSGRLIRVVLYGTLGTKTVSGNLFRAIFNANKPPGHPSLRSTLFDLAPIP